LPPPRRGNTSPKTSAKRPVHGQLATPAVTRGQVSSTYFVVAYVGLAAIVLASVAIIL
jgi:hypothetical protein